MQKLKSIKLKSIAGLAKTLKIKVYPITNLFKDGKITKKDCTILDGKVWLNESSVKKIKILLGLSKKLVQEGENG